MAAKLNPVNILVYLWIFCLYILISKIVFGLFWLFYKLLAWLGIDIETTLRYTGSYDSPVLGGPSHFYDFITAGFMMIVWAGLFFIITVIILILMIIWLIVGPIPILGDAIVNGKSPFEELTPVFNAILNKTSFKNLFGKYGRELKIILQENLRKYRKGVIENFEDKEVVEEFSTDKQHIDNDYYNEIEKYYKIKDNYYIGAYKSYKHSDEATLYKSYKIIIPGMDDGEISGIISENSTLTGKILSQSAMKKRMQI
jgi:ABC-type multidrug transport system fused ATPase/permease subunit